MLFCYMAFVKIDIMKVRSKSQKCCGKAFPERRQSRTRETISQRTRSEPSSFHLCPLRPLLFIRENNRLLESNQANYRNPLLAKLESKTYTANTSFFFQPHAQVRSRASTRIHRPSRRILINTRRCAAWIHILPCCPRTSLSPLQNAQIKTPS
ncbi:hypothetical protein K432DRAFT_44562 [Lepidopterella palustris CBS 459.81]|uniref:Uncharacterized protein n=1 Tax=Lepidopterella palustris CBS 459.81 TaxID=1314670 RepID=A0A8E2EAG0_9PEZI|nr:hypothetical protein K432DRAFT_44562 [Lepidopterella palustris CBS 459.81]